MKTKADLLTFMDRLAESLGNSDGQTTEEIRAELCEEMGEEKFLAAEKRFMEFVEELKGKSKNEK
jgi:hypothetical protein